MLTHFLFTQANVLKANTLRLNISNEIEEINISNCFLSNKHRVQRWPFNEKNPNQYCLNTIILNVKNIFEKFNAIDNKTFADNLNLFSNFKNNIKELNDKAHRHNSRFIIRFLSIFNKNYLCQTLDFEIQQINQKVNEVEKETLFYVPNQLTDEIIRRLKNGFRQSVSSDALFKVGSSEEKIKKILSAIKDNPKGNPTEYLSQFTINDLANALRRLINKELPEPILKKLHRIGLNEELDLKDKKTIKSFRAKMNMLDPVEKKFIQHLYFMISKVNECSWKMKNPNFLKMIPLVGFITKVTNENIALPLYNSAFITEHYKDIFEA